jgi:hypothetical protein
MATCACLIEQSALAQAQPQEGLLQGGGAGQAAPMLGEWLAEGSAWPLASMTILPNRTMIVRGEEGSAFRGPFCGTWRAQGKRLLTKVMVFGPRAYAVVVGDDRIEVRVGGDKEPMTFVRSEEQEDHVTAPDSSECTPESPQASPDKPQRPSRLSDQRLRQMLINQSISAYGRKCPCPYNVDRAGRPCGARSAWSRAGGEAPYCYLTDVPSDEVETLRASLAGD